MNDEIESYVFLELIKFIIIVSVILDISNALNFVISVISLLSYFLLVKQTHAISIEIIHNY